ncbi:hypothetical protein RchiOBHm_Chr6g0270591 [Rosa chinensis]|uniref:Uncharacterized protein n=1 Tax=Rosa chinensis TaxID=74649 RepID=A0A2P6PQQ6_ROSCH|nr:hypothetical protein RchiOBHm_Chr6g0270591 [Rosa chinensis]
MCNSKSQNLSAQNIQLRRITGSYSDRIRQRTLYQWKATDVYFLLNFTDLNFDTSRESYDYLSEDRSDRKSAREFTTIHGELKFHGTRWSILMFQGS